MDFDLINIFEMGLLTTVTILLLNHDPSVVIILAFKLNMVRQLDSKIVAGAQGVKHPSVPILICDSSGSFTTKIYNIDSVFAQY